MSVFSNGLASGDLIAEGSAASGRVLLIASACSCASSPISSAPGVDKSCLMSRCFLIRALFFQNWSSLSDSHHKDKLLNKICFIGCSNNGCSRHALS